MELSDAQDARRERGEELAMAQIDGMVGDLCTALQLAGTSKVKNYQLVGPAKRAKLKGLLNHYRKLPHPFTACVNDNTKRFGVDGAKKVCGVLTDLEKGTTKWRSGGSKKGVKASEDFAEQSVIDAELFSLLHDISEIEYRKIIGLEEAA